MNEHFCVLGFDIAAVEYTAIVEVHYKEPWSGDYYIVEIKYRDSSKPCEYMFESSIAAEHFYDETVKILNTINSTQ
jgi:hypothetical protein